MKKLTALLLALLLALSFTACLGENIVDDPIDGGDDEPTTPVTTTADVEEYKFAPPTDHFAVEYQIYYDTTPYKYIVTKSDNIYMMGFEDVERRIKYDFNEGKAYVSDWAEGSEWYEDSEEYSYADPYEELSVSEFNYFEEFFMTYFKAYGKDLSQLEDYCVGTEMVAGCPCWIFEGKGLNAVTNTFWVNMENGICMKSTDSDGNLDYEITKIDLNY